MTFVHYKTDTIARCLRKYNICNDLVNIIEEFLNIYIVSYKKTNTLLKPEDYFNALPGEAFVKLLSSSMMEELDEEQAQKYVNNNYLNAIVWPEAIPPPTLLNDIKINNLNKNKASKVIYYRTPGETRFIYGYLDEIVTVRDRKVFSIYCYDGHFYKLITKYNIIFGYHDSFDDLSQILHDLKCTLTLSSHMREFLKSLPADKYCVDVVGNDYSLQHTQYGDLVLKYNGKTIKYYGITAEVCL